MQSTVELVSLVSLKVMLVSGLVLCAMALLGRRWFTACAWGIFSLSALVHMVAPPSMGYLKAALSLLVVVLFGIEAWRHLQAWRRLRKRNVGPSTTALKL